MIESCLVILKVVCVLVAKLAKDEQLTSDQENFEQLDKKLPRCLLPLQKK